MKLTTYKNKSSGKHFVLIDTAVQNKALFVTPRGDIKLLENNLFNHEPFEEDDFFLLEKGYISQTQQKKCYEYFQSRVDEETEKFRFILDKMSPSEKKELLKLLFSMENDSRHLG